MNKHLTIRFFLPALARSPVGGFKVVYEYANRLSDRGHEVSVVHLIASDVSSGRPRKVVAAMKCLVWKVFGRRVIRDWFPLRSSVKVEFMTDPRSLVRQNTGAIIATGWQTAEALAAVFPDGRGCFYLIQHLETWGGHEERVLATWRTPLHKIVIARWLQEIGESMQEESFYLPNGLDFDRFYLKQEIETRSGPSVMMLYHVAADKGSADGLAALGLVRQQLPDLHAILFGISPRPMGLPDWIEYHQRPDQTALLNLYNSVQVFVAPSRTEGWGLPPSEAMMCGAALAATDVGGHWEFAKHEENALLSPPRNPERLAENTVRLLKEESLRYRLIRQGLESIRQFTWDKAVTEMEEHLHQVLGQDTWKAGSHVDGRD